MQALYSKISNTRTVVVSLATKERTVDAKSPHIGLRRLGVTSGGAPSIAALLTDGAKVH